MSDNQSLSDAQWITWANNAVSTIGARVSPNPAGSPGLQQDLSDRALATRNFNDQIFGH